MYPIIGVENLTTEQGLGRIFWLLRKSRTLRVALPEYFGKMGIKVLELLHRRTFKISSQFFSW